MTTEEKAKAYDEAIERLRNAFYDNNSRICEEYRKAVIRVIEPIFPELQVSENERIMEELKALVVWAKSWSASGVTEEDAKTMLAWLKKQGEQKPDTDFSDLRTWKYIVDAVWTEKEGIGQYLDSPFAEEVAKKLQKRFGNIKQKPAFEMKTPEGSLGIDSDTYSKIVDECIYGEQKPAWSEEDEENLNWFEKFFRAESVIAEGKNIPQDRYLWFKNLKDRVQPQQEWGEEDKKICKELMDFCIKCSQGHTIVNSQDDFARWATWLKSLRPQKWKPSEEQMNALNDVISSRDIKYDVLSELWKDLKQL